jgi:DNA-directed RNA polymerase I, II, and III subunit RPABC2
MSDNEAEVSDYYSENENESDSEPEPMIKIKIGNDKTLLPNVKVSSNIDDYEDSDSDEGAPDDDDDELNIQIGGVDDDVVSEPDDDDDISDAVSDDVDKDEEEGDFKDDLENTNVDLNKKNKTNKVKKPVTIDLPSDDDDDDYDDSYLQKFDSEITKNYINEFHPECLIHNYDEISKLTTVVRDSNNIIIDPLHKTIPFLTKYERARILGQRAKQIETGARPFVNVPENVIDSYVIAELELQQKRIPFIIRRPIPGGACEYWNLKDLEVILF